MTDPAAADGLCRDLEALCSRLHGGGGVTELRLSGLLARIFPEQAAQRDVLDPRLGVHTEAFLLRLVQAEINAKADIGVIAFHSDRLAEIRRRQGEEIARQVLNRLADFIKPRQNVSEWLGCMGSDSLALIIPQAGLLTAQERGQALHEALRRSSRFPVSTGVAHSLDFTGPAAGLLRLAQQAAEETRQAGDRRVHTRTVQGPAAMPAAAVPTSGEAGLAGASLVSRYQRLVLLNRMSLELFSDQPFPKALAAACSTILALTGARYVAVYFCDELGSPFLAHRHGDAPFAKGQALREENDIIRRSLAQRRILTGAGTRWGWVAAPLLHYRKAGPAEDGVFVVGFPEPRSQDPDLDQTMLEASRLLRNARLTQTHLEQQRVLAAVTEQSADAIYITDLDSRVMNWNSAAEDLFQYSREEALGRDALSLVPKDRLPELERLNGQALKEGCVKNFESVRLRKDGSLVAVEGTFFVLRDEKGRPFGTVRVFRDITRRKEVDRMKSEFVSLVSHELRTPLTAIQGFAETIFDFWDDVTPEQRRHYLSVILAEAKRLSNLVTNFLDISRLEAGGVALRPALVGLPDLSRRAAALFQEHPKNISFNINFAPGSEQAWADEDQLLRVFVNLCGNAVKYSPPGGQISVSGRLAGQNIEVSVADQGPGIPPRDQKHLFQKFYRVGDEVSRKTPGTGLGLAICKSIMDSHGGRIWVESQPGHGTVFKFAFPARRLKPK
ncbi:MAG TPA: hypothetical protein DEB40_11465 [Elusimicrobia bacterium]|nr:hypothetical protein [Elusimicrobiota bacterium]HBT62351.1 hypothetical protein [Elusimicrobiota bacterium]